MLEQEEGKNSSCNQRAFPAPHSHGGRIESEGAGSQPGSGSALLLTPILTLLLRRTSLCCTDIPGSGCQETSIFHSTSGLVYCFHYPLEKQREPYVFRPFWSRSHTDTQMPAEQSGLCTNSRELSHKPFLTPLSAISDKWSTSQLEPLCVLPSPE